jgi:Protein of unknown function (DUF3750)
MSVGQAFQHVPEIGKRLNVVELGGGDERTHRCPSSGSAVGWFGRTPELIFAADGPDAERMIPLIREAIRSYAYSNIGDYRAWPGPNSNTFVAAVIAAVPGMRAALPPTAVGKDFPIDRQWIGLTPSRTGIQLNLGGYFGIAIGWVEGIEVNLLSAVAGIDIRRPAIKLPGLGRLGLPSASLT